MEIIQLFIAGMAWLVFFWAGSIFLEATGMERAKARFQALSAVTGTGFTTRDTESVLNYPKRRNIVSWLIFLGATGAIGSIIVAVIFVSRGVPVLSSLHIIAMVIVVVTIALLIRLGVVNKLTGIIVGFIRRRNLASYLMAKEMVYQAGCYAVVRLGVSAENMEDISNLKNTGLRERGVTILAIERKDTVITLPGDGKKLLAGDYLPCYGKAAELTLIRPPQE